MYRITSPSRCGKPLSRTNYNNGRGQGGGARDRAGQENSSGLRTSQVSLTLNLLAKNRLGVCKTPILLRKTALLAASIKLPGKPLPPPPAAPSRLPARVLRPSGARPGPTEVATETGRWATCHRHVAAPFGEASLGSPPWGSCHGIAVTEGVFTHSSLFTLHFPFSPHKKRKKREPPAPSFYTLSYCHFSLTISARAWHTAPLPARMSWGSSNPRLGPIQAPASRNTTEAAA